MGCEWDAFRGDCTGRGWSGKSRAFSMRKPSMFPFLLGDRSKRGNRAESPVEAEVFVGGGLRDPKYQIEGSFRRRSCCIRRTSTGEVAARITRKRVNPKVLLGDEVFSLVVQPGLDYGLVMGFIVVLDRICPRPAGPCLCSC